ncbi:conserved hypothetical protein [Leishmania infantum JPCM5]|uniref:Uncharacterized protein n=3 Tax=Leishmania donovani species complex TaxID=38574 RepID=A4I3B6_LEIIN|nr:conserved hypothetical protein [Leishmania infantum JPCM5]XP_003862145.1 hypothetical protein, conserved [Leishmania donovani]CAC9501862.1 hypothetical_protein_-_conserved [Leishmania infantum]AYU80185.1 hypothetical protein LdCL_280008100 [Leishmania donovani]TPP54183.1 hypothetical protein CGC21_21710 [Leishmania donovani]CAM69270.1 conserved hypothetical protein [Leishmania infantum JPCM5]CBZ35451.1 hypothetical protein, conserved [Leishmania donovani]|eukprot:XP_001470078.1 conserved hypothetical protein [Leishmania infantum JPCM5]
MSSSMIPLSATAQRVKMLECGPCALRSAMRRADRESWTPPLADVAVDIVAGALTLTSANEVLVPASLVHYVESCRTEAKRTASGALTQWPWPAWDVALKEQRLVTLVTAGDVARLVSSDCYGGAYRTLCVPVPAGPLVAQLDFGITVDTFYAEVLPGVLDVVGADGRVRWRAWMRSALTCAYEGTHVPPIRVAEYTSQLLRQTGGCESVMWEAAVTGLTPRWLETASKTALAVGVPSGLLALALPEESGCTARLLAKSVEVGVTSWATCAVASSPLYPHTSPVASPQTVQLFTTGWNDVSAAAAPTCDGDAAVDAAEESLGQCFDFVDAVTERVGAVLHTDA